MDSTNRPPNTSLLISEQYVSELEQIAEEKDEKAELWKKCVAHTVDLLEILRDKYDEFDEVMKHFNEASDRIQFRVDADEQIKFKINNASEES